MGRAGAGMEGMEGMGVEEEKDEGGFVEGRVPQAGGGVVDLAVLDGGSGIT